MTGPVGRERCSRNVGSSADGFRFESHSIRGKDKMTARVGLALDSVRAKMRLRSLVRPLPAQAA